MKSTSIKLLSILIALVVFEASAAVKVGAPAPDFKLPDSHDQTRTLSEFAGQIVVLEWSNHDCPFVRKHYGASNMQALQKTYTDKGIVWLTIISSAPGKQGYVTPVQANTLTESRNAQPTAVLLDPSGDVGRLYGAKTTPHMYIIDADGTLVYMGGIDSIRSANPADIPKATAYVAMSLNEVLAGKSVSNPVTRPYGCTVKY